MNKYLPIKAGYYLASYWWPWVAFSGVLSLWVGIDFTDAADWGDEEGGNGNWSAISIVVLAWYFVNAVGCLVAPIRDAEDNAHYDYSRMVRNSRFNDREEKVVAKAQGDDINIYRITSGLNGKTTYRIDSYNVIDDLEAGDKAIEAAAAHRAMLKAKKEKAKELAKPKANPRAESVARVINKR
jgi:hypothetical protein